MIKDARVFNCGLWYGGHLHKGIYYNGAMHEELLTDSYLENTFGPNGTIIQKWFFNTRWGPEKYAFVFSYTGEAKIAVNGGGYIYFNDGSVQQVAHTEASISSKYGSHWNGKSFIDPVTVTCPATATVGVCINAPQNSTSWTNGQYDGARAHGTIPVIFGNGVTEVYWDGAKIGHTHKNKWQYTAQTYYTEELWLEKLFYGCQTLTEFPHEMLKKIISLDDYGKIHALNSAFAYTGIKEIKNGEFLEYDTIIWNNAFQGCQSLKALPEEFIGKTFKADSKWPQMEYAFSESGIEVLPNRVFSDDAVGANCIGMFARCKNIRYIPEGFITKRTNVSFMFLGCLNLERIPDDFFKNCARLMSETSKYASVTAPFAGSGIRLLQAGLFETVIPVELKMNGNDLTGVFRDCKRLQEVQSGVFKGLSASSDFSYMFMGCTALTTVPDNLLDGITEDAYWSASRLNHMFSGCSALRHLPPLWESVKPVLYANAYKYWVACIKVFDGCTAADNYGECPEWWKTDKGTMIHSNYQWLEITEEKYNELNAIGGTR